MSRDSLNRILDKYTSGFGLDPAKREIDSILFTYDENDKASINDYYSRSTRGLQNLRDYIVVNTTNNASPNLKFRDRSSGRRPLGGGKSKKRIGRKKSRKSKRRSTRSK